MNNIVRNFCIIAHIDHGKSTLADRFLEVTNTISQRDMKEQLLDQMDIERERGITIKLQPVRMKFQDHILNLIDTPGHVDFSYEVSRSLAAVEGVILLVDATQGIEAQTLANLYLALEEDLVIIPVINKIDLPNARAGEVKAEIVKLLGCRTDEVLEVSAKTGKNISTVLEFIIKRVPSPQGSHDHPLQALIFDSLYDEYRGVIAYVRVMEGTVRAGDSLRYMASGRDDECLEVGIFKPAFQPQDILTSGDIGYIVTGLKEVSHCRVGDTITASTGGVRRPMPGYRAIKPMVFAGVFCQEGDEYPRLREGIEKISLNDAALTYEPEDSAALGFGFRCGFLGVLHLEIFQERLKREYGLELVITAPSVGYRVLLNRAGINTYRRKDKDFNGDQLIVTSPAKLPEKSLIEKVLEPWVSVDIVTPREYIGDIMTLIQKRRGAYKNTEYLDEYKVILHYELPLAGIIVDFYDTLKSVSSGFASLNYNLIEYRPCTITVLDIIIADDKIEALANIVYVDEAYRVARKIVDTLKEVLPRQQFEIKIQASLGGKIIAASRIAALRKDVTAKLYGGDVTRKRKLLEKQKKGKRKMRQRGSVTIPQSAYMAVLKR